MVSRFLAWSLPATFAPDCGISFDGRKDDEWNKNKTWPIGTNLLTAIEARAMLEHVVGSHPPLTLEQAREAVHNAFEVRPEMCGDDLVLIRAAEKAHGIW